jgi:hypothetical protein
MTAGDIHVLPHVTVQEDFPLDISNVQQGKSLSASFWLSIYNDAGLSTKASIHASVSCRKSLTDPGAMDLTADHGLSLEYINTVSTFVTCALFCENV